MWQAMMGMVGGGIAAYGKVKQAEAQAQAARDASWDKSQQADETMMRSLINQEAIRRQSRGMQASIQSSYAASGVRIDSGSPLDVLETVALEYDREIANKYIEDSFKADQLRKEASSLAQASADITEAGYISAWSSMLGSAGGAAGSMGGG